MVKRFKVWTYREGEPPFVHEGPIKSIYGIEGYFIQEIQRGNTSFSAAHPDEAHVFFLPISVGNIVSHLYNPLVTYARDQLITTVTNYTDLITHKHPFWNRTNGADHLLLSCHDWAPEISTKNPDKQLYRNIIRALCNANKSEGFNPSRDVSIPEINLRYSESSNPRNGQHPQNRSILAFFAGGIHGSIRKTLIETWKGKDKQLQVYEYLPPNIKYLELMERSKFCLCPSGFEVASPRTVEAIYAGCIPVIIADDYEPPFSDILDWSKFSLHIPSEKISELKVVLQSVEEGEYLRMHRRVLQVQRHFEVNRPSKAYDVFHMILHSVWLRRINISIRS
ncbi:probable glycosyltransferase At5g11130 [Prosopis cineraria]|uniref:probable glycosyltransferase At5g11130 n=1 Tax=Prosopis cineraria TaxID=364024 RepID=UPI00240EB162|nr:probable glycosyltransferase At5g11130 [Prosopis cineraria]